MDHEVAKIRSDTAKAVLDSYKEQYKDLTDAWKAMEGKAQGTVAIAGLFLAATFAYVRDRTGFESEVVRCAIALAVLLLVGSVVCALLALKVRKIPVPPFGVRTMSIAEDLLSKSPADMKEAWPAFSLDQATWWGKVNLRIVDANANKSRWVWVSQLLLGMSLGVVAVITMALLIVPSIEP